MGHKLNLILSGSGPAEHELRRQVKQLNLINTIHFTPPIETMISVSDAYKAVLQSVDIFIQPWPSRLWHPPLLESMSVGNAVIIADGIKNDLLINGKTAITVPFHDEQALTDSLDKLLKDPIYAQNLAKQSQDYLRKHFLASQMIARLAKAYRQALKTRNE